MTQETVEEVFVTAKTKSGVEIRYEDNAHQYWVRDDPDGTWFECDFSMSGVADVLAKDALVWWGMQVGLNALPSLIEQNFIRIGIDPATGQHVIIVMGATAWERPTLDNLTALVKRQKLTTNHVKELAGKRGVSVHGAMEAWVNDGIVPDPQFYPEEEQGYIKGLLAFITDVGTFKSKPQAEIMVGSVEHRIAGRYDLEAVLQPGTSLVTKLPTPSWKDPATLAEGEKNHHSAKPAERTVYEGRTLFDLKTSKDAYFGYKLQMVGYEGCRIECGMPKTNQQLIVVVHPEGTYKVTDCNDITWQDFLDVLNVARLVKAKGGR